MTEKIMKLYDKAHEIYKDNGLEDRYWIIVSKFVKLASSGDLIGAAYEFGRLSERYGTYMPGLNPIVDKTFDMMSRIVSDDGDLCKELKELVR